MALNPGQVLTVPSVPAARAGVGDADPNEESPIGLHLQMPIACACLTTDYNQMPNSPREYRNGTHEGVDFFTGYACVDVAKGDPALAAADGTVIRADHQYKDLTQDEIDHLIALTFVEGYTDEGTLDKFRGRQVWIDHGNGIVTRYCHLSDIPADIQPGVEVKAGDMWLRGGQRDAGVRRPARL